MSPAIPYFQRQQLCNVLHCNHLHREKPHQKSAVHKFAVQFLVKHAHNLRNVLVPLAEIAHAPPNLILLILRLLLIALHGRQHLADKQTLRADAGKTKHT